VVAAKPEVINQNNLFAISIEDFHHLAKSEEKTNRSINDIDLEAT